MEKANETTIFFMFWETHTKRNTTKTRHFAILVTRLLTLKFLF